MEGKYLQRICLRPGAAVWLAILVALLCAASACRISSESDEGGTTAAAVIGTEGGVAEVTDAGSAIYGAKVYIPAGALQGDRSITLSPAVFPAALPYGHQAGGGCIDFHPDGLMFDQPVLLYLPYADTNNDGIIDGRAVREEDVCVLYFNGLNSRWEEMPLYGADTASNLAVVESEHFSTYLVSVDTADARTIDSDTPDTDTEPSFEPGECYLGDDVACHYSHMTILRRETGLTAIVDRNLTYVNSGIVAVISEDGTSATFDAVSAFAKVLASGDATRWNWEGEFVREHTFLMDYGVREDDSLSTSEAYEADTGGDEGGIFCTVEAVDTNMVTITWGINAFEQIIYQTTPQGAGHCLAIRFRATHQ